MKTMECYGVIFIKQVTMCMIYMDLLDCDSPIIALESFLAEMGCFADASVHKAVCMRIMEGWNKEVSQFTFENKSVTEGEGGEEWKGSLFSVVLSEMLARRLEGFGGAIITAFPQENRFIFSWFLQNKNKNRKT